MSTIGVGGPSPSPENIGKALGAGAGAAAAAIGSSVSKASHSEWIEDHGSILKPFDKTDITKDGKLNNDTAKAMLSFTESPKEIVDNIRNANGKVSQYKELVDFQSKLDSMPAHDLKELRDYIGEEMAKPENKDDELLGVLLKSVNKELDSRESVSFHHPNIFPEPLYEKPPLNKIIPDVRAD